MTWESWQAVVDEVAPTVLGAGDLHGEALAAQVQRLSLVYTRRGGTLTEASDALAARLRFFFLRDLYKVNGPLIELGDALPSGPVWSVLDLGAGLGTSTLGLAAFARERGVEALRVTAVERDAPSLDVFESLARAARRRDLIPPLELTTRRQSVTEPELARLPEADVVLAGLVLNELFEDLDGADRLDAAEAWLRAMVERLRPGGSVIVLEPALRESSRALQRLRGRLTEHVYAPCLRAGECPLLRRKRDWCHASLPLDLPPRLAALAKSAGLRGTRLTYAYLTLRADRRRLEGFGDPRALRVVGGPVESKGKLEWDGCGEPGLVRLRRLDRERGEANQALDHAVRGSRIRLPAPLEDGASVRLRPSIEVERI